MPHSTLTGIPEDGDASGPRHYGAVSPHVELFITETEYTERLELPKHETERCPRHASAKLILQSRAIRITILICGNRISKENRDDF